MKNSKGLIVIAAIVTAVTIGACRKEVEHTPMKLGAPIAEQVAR
jgi:hypothetical protein